MRQAVALGLVLLAFWWVLSGHAEVPLLALAVVSCIICVAVVLRMEVVDRESVPFHLTGRALLFVPWLVWEVVKSNVDVGRRVLAPGPPIRPLVFRVRAGQRDEFGHVIYANSITLTPGTISLDVAGGEITVHALTHEAAAALARGEMDRRVTAAVDGR